MTAKVTGVPGKDFNSGLKAMTRELADTLEMYGELHRYIPVLAVWNGFRVGELDVEHHERRHGTSKFGRARFWRGFLDLVTVKFLTTYTARPFHLFGGIGFVIGLVGGVLLAWMGVSKLTGHDIGTRPALQLGVLLVVVAVQMLSLGLLGELMVNLRRRRNLDATAEGDLRVTAPARPDRARPRRSGGGGRPGREEVRHRQPGRAAAARPLDGPAPRACSGPSTAPSSTWASARGSPSSA